MFSRLKQLVIAALVLSTRGLDRVNSITGAYKSDRLETNALLTRHVLHPDPHFAACTLGDGPAFYLNDAQAFTLDHFSACDAHGDNILHAIARSGDLNTFTEALTKAPTSLLYERNSRGESLTDAILASNNHDLLIPLFLATEAEQTVVSSALFNRQLNIKLANHPSDLLKHQVMLQSLAMNKYIKPRSEAGKALFHKNRQRLIEQGGGLYLLIDFDILSYDFEAALNKVQKEKLKQPSSPHYNTLIGLEYTLPRLMHLTKTPYKTMRQWTLLETLVASQSLPAALPNTHPDMRKMHGALHENINYLHESTLWAVPTDEFNEIQAKLTVMQSMHRLLEENPDHSKPDQLNQLHGLVEAIISHHEHDIHARWVINHALVLKANLLLRHGSINNRELLQLLLQLQLTCPGSVQEINQLLVQLYESGLSDLSPAEELLTLRVIMSQSFFKRWEKKAAVLHRYKQQLTNYQPDVHGYLLKQYDELDSNYIMQFYPEEGKAMVALERSRFQQPDLQPEHSNDESVFASIGTHLTYAVPIAAAYFAYRKAAKVVLRGHDEYRLLLEKAQSSHLRLLDTYWPFMEPTIKPDDREAIKNAIGRSSSAEFFRNHNHKVFVQESMLVDEITLAKKQDYKSLASGTFTFTPNKKMFAEDFNALIHFAIDFNYRLLEPNGIPLEEHEEKIKQWVKFINKKISLTWENQLNVSETYQQLLKDEKARKKPTPTAPIRTVVPESPSPEALEMARLREAEARLTQTKAKLVTLVEEAKALAAQFDKAPTYTYASIELKVADQAEHPEMKKLLSALKTKFENLDTSSKNEEKAKAALTQSESIAEAALSSTELTALQTAIATLEQSLDQAKHSIAVTQKKISAIQKAKPPLQALFRDLNTRQRNQAPVLVKPKQTPEEAERHRLFKAQRAERKRVPAAPKAAAPAGFPVIVINDALGIPLLKAAEALNGLEFMPFAVETFTSVGVLSLNVFLYTQLFEALLTLSDTILSAGLPPREDLVRYRNQFVHNFQKIVQDIDGAPVDWIGLAEESRAAFLPFVTHYLGNQAAPAAAIVPQPFARLFEVTDDYVHHDTTLSAIKADYLSLASFVEQQKIVDVNSAWALALRGMVIQLSELTNTTMLTPYRNQEAHNDLQSDMSVETLLNLRKAIAKIIVKSARGPRLFGGSANPCPEETPPLRLRSRTKRN